MSDSLGRISPLARSGRACGGGRGGDGGRESKTEADAVAPSHLGWATEAQAPRHRGAQAAQRAAPEEARACAALPGARHVARPAPRLEPPLAPLFRSHLGVLLARPRPLRLPPRPLFRARQPSSPPLRSPRREGARPVTGR